MKFFHEEPKSLDTARVEDLAQRLYSAIRTERKLIQGATQASFTKKITSLCHSKGVEEVEQVIDWYINHFEDEFTPQVGSAVALVNKFEAIVSAMDRSDFQPTDEAIEERNAVLALNLQRSHLYPVEILAHLPLLVQRTRTRWDEFWERPLDKCIPVKTREADFILEINKREASVFTGNWMIYLSHKYGKLYHYYGSVTNLAFKPSSEAFKKHFWQQWSLEWSGTVSTFDGLLTTLLKEKV